MKLSKRADIEKAEKLLAELDAHPATTKYREDKAAEVLTTRREVAGRIEALRNEQAATIPILQDALKATEAIYATAKTTLEAAAEEVRAATLALRRERLTFDNTIRICEATLYESVDPAINAAILHFQDKLDFLRKPGRISTNRIGGERNIFTDMITVRAESNVAAIHSAMKYCRAAITTLEEMKLAPAPDFERIEALKVGIPDTGEMTEFSSSKPLPQVPQVIIPRFGNACSDEYEQTLLDRVHKKAKDFLSKPAGGR